MFHLYLYHLFQQEYPMAGSHQPHPCRVDASVRFLDKESKLSKTCRTKSTSKKYFKTYPSIHLRLCTIYHNLSGIQSIALVSQRFTQQPLARVGGEAPPQVLVQLTCVAYSHRELKTFYAPGGSKACYLALLFGLHWVHGLQTAPLWNPWSPGLYIAYTLTYMYVLQAYFVALSTCQYENHIYLFSRFDTCSAYDYGI